MSRLDTPILFVIFNRPDFTKITFSRIREARPKRIFIAADGPRKNRPDDIEKCRTTRELVLSMIDWDCEVKTLFRDTNLGCGTAVSGAIDWFFEHVEEGIILEDDCLPIPFFFTFAHTMLERYRNDARIMHISGNNFVTSITTTDDILFSNYTHSWGWATWRRSWKLYDFNLTDLEETFEKNQFKFLDKEARNYWLSVLRNTKAGGNDIWDYQWIYTTWRNGGVSIIPKWNLVTNIGFGENSTHTSQDDGRFSSIITKEFDLVSFPNKIEANEKFDNQFFKIFLKEKGKLDRIFNKLRKWLN